MTDGLPPHIPYFPLLEDCLLVGGQPLTRLAKRIGTPFYAYERRLLDERIALLRRMLPSSLHLHYAIKANPMAAVVNHLAPQLDGLDVASLGELHLALDSGTAPESISFAGPGKRPAEIQAAIAAGVTLNLESERELDIATQMSTTLGYPAQVAVRVNPDFQIKGAGMKMGGVPRPFGVDAERVPALLSAIGERGLDFRGLHLYVGSQILNPAAIIEAQSRTIELALRLAEVAPSPLAILNIGGGFGIPYFAQDRPLDLAPIATAMEDSLAQLATHLPTTQVVMELGRYLVGEAGIYVCRVLDRKISQGQVFLVTDGGLHHHLAASGNFGQVIRKNYPVVVGNRVQGKEREVASVVGPLCTPLDLLADRLELTKAAVGDLIVIFQSGAYGRSASPLGFLSHPPPGEILI